MKLSTVYVSPRWCPTRLVVQKLDSAIHQINHYPTGSIREINSVIHRIEIYSVDSIIHHSNNWWVQINHYPADMYHRNQLRYPLDKDLSSG